MSGRSSPLIGNLHWRLKRLGYLWQRTRGSLALRGWRGTLVRMRQGFPLRPGPDETLALQPPGEPFALPVSDEPHPKCATPNARKVLVRKFQRRGNIGMSISLLAIGDAIRHGGSDYPER